MIHEITYNNREEYTQTIEQEMPIHFDVFSFEKLRERLKMGEDPNVLD